MRWPVSTEPIDLDAAQALADAATPGPWRWGDDNDGNGNTLIRAGRRWDALANLEFTSDENGDFICQARTLVPALIAELREERERSQKYREFADHLREILGVFDPAANDYVTALTALHRGVLNGPSCGGFNTLHESTRGHGVEAMRAVLAKLDLDGVLKAPIEGGE